MTPEAEDGRPGVEAAHRLQDTELELERGHLGRRHDAWCPSNSVQSSLSQPALGLDPLVQPRAQAGVMIISWKVSMPSRVAKSAVSLALCGVICVKPVDEHAVHRDAVIVERADGLLGEVDRQLLADLREVPRRDALNADHHRLAAGCAHQLEELVVDLAART